MDLLLAMWIAYYLVKNTTQDLVYKATGKMPPSYLREQERRKRRAERQPVTDRTEGRRFFANAWHDAWESAGERREHGRDQRRADRRDRWARQDAERHGEPLPEPEPVAGPEVKPSTGGVAGPEVTGMDVADPIKAAAPPPEPPAGVVHDDPTFQLADGAVDLSRFDVPGGVDEEVMYRRYALRRTNGAAMTPEQIAAEIAPHGNGARQAEALHQRLDARYVQDNPGAERIPPPDLAKTAARMACNDCGGKTQLEADPSDPCKWIMRTTHTSPDCPQDTARAREAADKEMKQVPADSDPSAPTTRPVTMPAPTITAPQINGMESDMSASGETTGLSSALAYTSAMATSSGEGANSVETSLASLTSGEVGGETLTHLTSAQEHLAAAQAAFNAANAALTQHQNVQEAYAANPDAGNKQFMQND
jgi:hypothetical protein